MTLNWYNTQNNYPFSPKNPLRISQNSQSLKFVHACHWIIQIILNPCSIQKNRHVFSDPKADISFLIWKKYVCVFDVKVILKKHTFDIIILTNGVYLLKTKPYAILIDMHTEIYRKVSCLTQWLT